MKILVVNGSPTERTVYTAQLTWLGFEFESAGTAEEALALLKSEKIAAVLLSWQLAGEESDGIVLLRRIRAEAEWAKLPVLLVTSLDDLARIEEAHDAVASEFLVQPSDVDTLLGKLLILGVDPEPVREMRVVSRPRPATDPAAPTAARSPEDPEARRAA